MVSIAWSLPFCFMLSLSSSASVCVSNDRGSITSTSLTIRGRNPDRLLPKGKNDRRVRWIVDPYFGIWGMHTVGIHQRSRSMTNAVTSSDIPPNIRCDACPCYNESTSDDFARPGPDEVPIWSYLRGYVRTVPRGIEWRVGREKGPEERKLRIQAAWLMILKILMDVFFFSREKKEEGEGGKRMVMGRFRCLWMTMIGREGGGECLRS